MSLRRLAALFAEKLAFPASPPLAARLAAAYGQLMLNRLGGGKPHES